MMMCSIARAARGSMADTFTPLFRAITCHFIMECRNGTSLSETLLMSGEVIAGGLVGSVLGGCVEPSRTQRVVTLPLRSGRCSGVREGIPMRVVEVVVETVFLGESYDIFKETQRGDRQGSDLSEWLFYFPTSIDARLGKYVCGQFPLRFISVHTIC